MHICLLGVSSVQVQLKEIQVDKEDNQKLSDLVSVKNKEINELKLSSCKLEDNIFKLRQEVQGQFLSYVLLLSLYF